MARYSFLVAAAAVVGCAAFAPARSPLALSTRRTAPKAGPFDDPDAYVAPSPPPKGRLGSSVDQDGKSNIWAGTRVSLSRHRGHVFGPNSDTTSL